MATRHGIVSPPYILRRELKFSFASQWCDWIVAVCDKASDNLRAAPLAKREKVVRVYNGASALPFDDSRVPFKSGFTLLHVGRLTPAKDQQTLLHAFAIAKKRIPDLQLWIVGEGPQRRELEKIASEIGRGAVNFVGEQTSVAPFFFAADAFVLSSVTEGVPVALLEALSAGLPAITTEVGGLTEIACRSEAVKAVPARDPFALSAEIVRLAEARDQLPKLRAKAEQCYSKHFTVERMASQYMALYTSKHTERDAILATDAPEANSSSNASSARRMAG